MAVGTYKVLNGMGPEYLSTLFSKLNNSTAETDDYLRNKIPRLFRDPSLEYVTSS